MTATVCSYLCQKAARHIVTLAPTSCISFTRRIHCYRYGSLSANNGERNLLHDMGGALRSKHNKNEYNYERSGSFSRHSGKNATRQSVDKQRGVGRERSESNIESEQSKMKRVGAVKRTKRLTFDVKNPAKNKVKQTLLDIKEPLSLFVSCLPGLEPLLLSELSELLASSNAKLQERNGGVDCIVTSAGDIYRCHLHLGTASHILLRCGEPFWARGMAELRRKVARMDCWNKLLEEDAVVVVQQVTSTKSKLFHTTGIAERVQKGISDALGRDVGSERHYSQLLPSDCTKNQGKVSPRSNPPEVKVQVRVCHDFVQLSLDTSVTPLHRRDYRLAGAKAPLREDLAFALLYGAGWSRGQCSDVHTQYDALLDPFCGSGTIVIEAAAMMAGLPPGRLRRPPLSGTRLARKGIWKEMVIQSMEHVRKPPISIYASDRDKGAIGATTANAERAGVANCICVECLPFTAHPWLVEPSLSSQRVLMVTNPPYGKRLSPEHRASARASCREHLLALYQTLGNRINRLDACAGKTLGVALLVHNIQLARRTGIPLLKAGFTTQHGGLPVTAMIKHGLDKLI